MTETQKKVAAERAAARVELTRLMERAQRNADAFTELGNAELANEARADAVALQKRIDALGDVIVLLPKPAPDLAWGTVEITSGTVPQIDILGLHLLDAPQVPQSQGTTGQQVGGEGAKRYVGEYLTLLNRRFRGGRYEAKDGTVYETVVEVKVSTGNPDRNADVAKARKAMETGLVTSKDGEL